jgi:uncharacterized delta-60 repeat protein
MRRTLTWRMQTLRTPAFALWPLKGGASLVAALLVSLVLATVAGAVPGDLDPTFSGDGKQTTPFGGRLNGVAIQPNGKIVAVGIAGGEPNKDFALARYNPDGSLDRSFSGDGRLRTDFGGNDFANGVALQGNGNIIAAGLGGNGDFALARYTPGGSLDPRFSGDGKLRTDFGGRDSANDVAIQPGEIVAVGAGGATGEDFALARYNKDGSLDRSFSGDGKQTTDFGPDDEADAVLLQPDGRIVAVGGSTIDEFGDFALARYNENGALDRSFAGDGKQITDRGAPDFANAAALQGDGKIVAAGLAGGGPSDNDFALVRYNRNGSLDTSFGDDGSLRTDLGGSDFANGVAIQPDGRIVTVGHAGAGPGRDFGVARYNADGSLDRSFSGDGMQRTNFAGFDEANDLAIQTDGKMVAVGRSFGSDGIVDFALARYQTGAPATTGALTQPVGAAGCLSETGSGPCADGHALEFPYGVAVSPDGMNVYVGSDNGVVRLNRNTTSGAISQPAGTAGCISENGAGPCADGHALSGGAGRVAVSPDGKNVYVVSSNAVVRLNRNTSTGAISQPAGPAGCISENGAGPCADGHALDGANDVAVSADGKNVYASSLYSDAVVRLNRNTTTGAIAQPAGTAGCISDTGAGPCTDGHALNEPFGGIAISADGKSLYVASAPAELDGTGAVVRLNRNTGTGALSQPAGTAGCISDDGFGPCADGHALFLTNGVVVSPDGKNVYAASNFEFLVRLNRNTTTGAISQPAGSAGCIEQPPHSLDPSCADGHAISPASVAVSSDGTNVYLASLLDDAVARLNRNTTNGAISQPAGSTGCVSQTGSGGTCADGHALKGPRDVAVSPDGKSVYLASSDSDAVVRFNRTP